MKNRLAIITGGTAGIGLALQKALTNDGYKVVVIALEINDLEPNVSSKVRSLKPKDVSRPKFYPLDLADDKSLSHFIKQDLVKFKSIDLLICCAGLSMRAGVQNCQMEVLRRVQKVNFSAHRKIIKSALPAIEKAGGKIVAINSLAGQIGLAERSAYASSKFALKGFMESLQLELCHIKSPVKTLSCFLNYVDTDIRKKALGPMGSPVGLDHKKANSFMSPEKAAQNIMRAVSKKKEVVFIGRNSKLLVFISKIAPRFGRWLNHRWYKKEN